MSDLIGSVVRAMLCNARQCWEQGIAAYAIAEMEDWDLLIPMCHDIVIRQRADGRLCDVENSPTITDPAICVVPLRKAAQVTGNDAFLRAAERNIQYLLTDAPRNEDGILYHIEGTKEIWADSAAMTPANLAMAGHVQMAVRQMEGICSCLRDAETGLFSHIWDDGAKRMKIPDKWCAGEGWIATGLAWLILALKDDVQPRQNMLDLYCDFVDAMDRYRLPNGLFHTNVDCVDSFVDCEGAAMLGYSALKLYNAGFRDSAICKGAAHAFKVRDEITRHIDRYGFIHDCPGSPRFSESGTSTEMQAFYLMLCAEARKSEETNCTH